VRRNLKRHVKWKLSIPADLAAQVELRLPFNDGQACPAYGARSALVADLLQEWLAGYENPTAEPPPAISEGA
jgi:hypothetical protein